MAEAHPVGFQWVEEARKRGATVVHVDPRFTRTSAQADRHIPLRAGSDIALLGGLINHVLTTDAWFHEYVLAFTNASRLVDEAFRDTDDLDGLFSGFDPDAVAYDPSSWAYAQPDASGPDAAGADAPGTDAASVAGSPAAGPKLTDPTLTDPRCVLQVLKRHFARYTPELVERACGVSQADFAWLANALTSNSGRERTSVFCYATGWTQHTDGAQIIRAAGILQLLLGNMGRPGGGIMALRGHACIQGSTDIPTLYNLLPGYLPMPIAGVHDTFADYVAAVGPADRKGYWAGAEAYTVSLLKAWWGDAATAENDWCYGYLPRLNGAHGTYQTMYGMLADQVAGFFVLGQNPAVGSAHGRLQREALAHLKWLVVRDLRLIETATFWKDSPEIASGEAVTEDIGTEVFFLPAATHAEKAGSFTQTHRLVQWRHKAVAPPGEARSELEFFYELGRKIRERLAGSTDPRDRPLLDLTWYYPTDATGEIDPESVLAEINGRHLSGPDAGRPVDGYGELAADGTTASGCWLYAGVYAGGVNRAATRTPHGGDGPTTPEWGWAWPANRRVLYNRASADPDGVPWSERKKLVWWDSAAERWVGDDVPDFPAATPPGYRAGPDARGAGALDGDDPFVMQSDGKGWLYAPRGLVDGPLPTHYEAAESPVANPLYAQQANPARTLFRRADNPLAGPAGTQASEVYPYIFTTYRLTEHHTAGGMSRWLPYLAELQPEMFCEVSAALAADRGLENGGWATIVSPRSAIEARVLVSERVSSLMIEGREVHQIGLPYHWGVGGDAVVAGDSANDLLGLALDPNVQIQESKVGSCDIQPGRRPRGRAVAQLVEQYRRRGGLA